MNFIDLILKSCSRIFALPTHFFGDHLGLTCLGHVYWPLLILLLFLMHTSFPLVINSFSVSILCLQALNLPLLLSVCNALVTLSSSETPTSYQIQCSFQVKFPIVNVCHYLSVAFLLSCFVAQHFANVFQDVLPLITLHSFHGTAGMEILQRVWPVISHTGNSRHPCRKSNVLLEIEIVLDTYSLDPNTEDYLKPTDLAVCYNRTIHSLASYFWFVHEKEIKKKNKAPIISAVLMTLKYMVISALSFL